MNKQPKETDLNWMSMNRPSTLDTEQNNQITFIEGGMQPTPIKMVRPFAEAEEIERQRRERKALEREKERERLEQERMMKIEEESRPKQIKMVRPFAEAEEIERQRRENQKIQEQREKMEKNKNKNIEKNALSSDSKTFLKSPPQNISDKPNIIPSQLNITIRTSVPGYQKIEYTPSMTIKDSIEKSVKFNPLINLNESKINNIPQEYRIKQFFNSDLFKSLLTHNGGKPAKNLVQATRYGYVDNNIKVTLNSIFPVGSVIYIGKNPYAIYDHQWTTGDWKIEKIKDGNKTAPTKLPQSIIVGNNYSGPPIIILPTSTSPSKNMTGGDNLSLKTPNVNNQDQLAYSITIDMEVHPGTSLTPEQIKQSKCDSRYNAIKKAFAEFTGRPYTIKPVYHETINNAKNNSSSIKGGKRKTRKNR